MKKLFISFAAMLLAVVAVCVGFVTLVVPELSLQALPTFSELVTVSGLVLVAGVVLGVRTFRREPPGFAVHAMRDGALVSHVAAVGDHGPVEHYT